MRCTWLIPLAWFSFVLKLCLAVPASMALLKFSPCICSQKVAVSEGSLIKNHIPSNCHFVYEKV
jgi:hypothetical protein